MRKLMIVAIALAVGCATGGQETKKSEAINAQDQAHQALVSAADAQKRASDEQAKAEKAQTNVEQAQRALADSQAKSRGQRMKAEQAQSDAQRLSQQAQQDVAEHQAAAMSAQQTQAQQSRQLNQGHLDSWTQQKVLEGRVIRVSGNELQIKTIDQGMMKLDVSDSTAVNLDGQGANLAQIRPGADVRASYQLIDGKAKALHVDATSAALPPPAQDSAPK
jgi:colicin import membrane protein